MAVENQTPGGNVTADAISKVTLTKKNQSALTGAINAENTARAAGRGLLINRIFYHRRGSNRPVFFMYSR